MLGCYRFQFQIVLTHCKLHVFIKSKPLTAQMARMWSREDKGIFQGHTASERGSRPEHGPLLPCGPFLSVYTEACSHHRLLPAAGNGCFPTCCSDARPSSWFREGCFLPKTWSDIHPERKRKSVCLKRKKRGNKRTLSTSSQLEEIQ